MFTTIMTSLGSLAHVMRLLFTCIWGLTRLHASMQLRVLSCSFSQAWTSQ